MRTLIRRGMAKAQAIQAQVMNERPAHLIIPAALVVYAAGILALPALQGDEQLALGLVLLLPALLAGAYVVMQTILGDRLAGTIVAVGCIFISAANFRARAYDDKSIDWQVGLKLVALALLLAMAAVFLAYAFNRIKLGRLFYAWLVFFAGVIACSLYAESVTFALTCSISFLVCYIYAVYMTVWLSRIRAIEIMMLAALLMCVGSIVVYFAVPSMGRMQAWTAGATFGDTGRMKGLTGSANAIGMIAAFAFLLSVLYYRAFATFGRRLAIVLVPAALTCLVLSNNRSSMIAIAAALWFASLCRSNTNFKLVLSITGALLGAAALFAFSDEIFSLVSRSGRAEEVTSATGRSAIWAVVIELWAQRPLFGYGYTSALSILPLDPRLFNVAAHAHNMVLELLFAGGIALLALFFYAVVQTFLQMYRLGAINESALFVFFLTRGLSEAGPFGAMTGYTSIAFAVTIALVVSKSVDAARSHAIAASYVNATRAVPALRSSPG